MIDVQSINFLWFAFENHVIAVEILSYEEYMHLVIVTKCLYNKHECNLTVWFKKIEINERKDRKDKNDQGFFWGKKKPRTLNADISASKCPIWTKFGTDRKLRRRRTQRKYLYIHHAWGAESAGVRFGLSSGRPFQSKLIKSRIIEHVEER